MIHGKSDDMINYRHAEQLFELISTRKLLISPPTMLHNTNLMNDAWLPHDKKLGDCFCENAKWKIWELFVFIAFFWHVLCFFFEDMNYLVMPATHFFSLPDYIFQDLRTVVGEPTGIAWLMLMQLFLWIFGVLNTKQINTTNGTRGEIHLQDCLKELDAIPVCLSCDADLWMWHWFLC